MALQQKNFPHFNDTPSAIWPGFFTTFSPRSRMSRHNIFLLVVVVRDAEGARVGVRLKT